eukprot:c13654_g1_i3.p1 GENE.c13654_g1_i3~~c13654_g1_i3.p1  ORF type:complete len:335 (+),score=69.02 c13654_g1_i3:47-1006(+)
MSGAYQVQCVLQFLKENGWTNTFECLELESGISFDETLVEAPNTLSAALIAAHVEGQEVGGMVPLDDDLLHQADGLYCRELVATHPTFHTKSALCVRFNKDGRWLASGSSDKAVRIATTIQNPDSTVKHTITPHTAGVLDLDWNPINEKLLLTSSMDRSHVVTNIDTILNQSPEQSTATALLHDHLPHQVFRDHTKFVNRGRWNLDGQSFVTISHDSTLGVYSLDEDASTDLGFHFAKTHRINFAAQCLEGLTFIQKDKCLVTKREDYRLYQLDLVTQNLTHLNMNERQDTHVSFTALDVIASPTSPNYAVVITGQSAL